MKNGNNFELERSDLIANREILSTNPLRMRLAKVYSPKREVEFENMPNQNIENQPLLKITAKVNV
jgi:hypothetical protein